MVERYRRGKGKKPLLGSHQKCWLWGRNVVLETLRAGIWPIHELYVAEAPGSATDEEAHRRAAESGIPVVVEPAESLRRRCHSSEHQGILARMAPFPYADAEQINSPDAESRLVLICDSIQDPYNFGALIRTADAMAVDGILIANSNQVGVTSHVARTSAGAVNHVPIARVDCLITQAQQFRRLGFHVVAASEKSGTPLFECDFLNPTVIVVGNEGTGIRSELIEACDEAVMIPQAGSVSSLNAAISVSILLYEVQRQRMTAT